MPFPVNVPIPMTAVPAVQYVPESVPSAPPPVRSQGGFDRCLLCRNSEGLG